MVDIDSRRNGKMSTSVDILRERKNIKLSKGVYDELLKLKIATKASSFDELIQRLLEDADIDPVRVAEKKIEALERELAAIVPYAYGAISQALVFCRLAVHYDKDRCEWLQMELLSLLREVRKLDEKEESNVICPRQS